MSKEIKFEEAWSELESKKKFQRQSLKLISLSILLLTTKFDRNSHI